MDNNKSDKKITAIGVLLIVIGLCVFLSLISYEQLPNGDVGSSTGGYDSCSINYNQNEESNNLVGRTGDSFHCLLRYKGFGIASIVIPIIFFLWGVTFIKGINRENAKKTFYKSIHYLSIMVFFSIYSSKFNNGSFTWSGNFGVRISEWLFATLGFGLWLIGIAIIFLYISFLFNIPISKIFYFLADPIIKISKLFYRKILEYYKKKKELKDQKQKEDVIISIDQTVDNSGSSAQEAAEGESAEQGNTVEEGFADEKNALEEAAEEGSAQEGESAEEGNAVEEGVLDDNLDQDSIDVDLEKVQITDEQKVVQVNLDDIENRRAKIFHYKLPTSDLLDDPAQIDADVSEEVLRARGEELIDALSSFGVQGKIVEIKKGPVITLYEIEPAEGVRVNKFTNLSDDLARVMKAQRIRVLAPIPGTKYIGIELPNEIPQIVYLKTILNSKKYAESESPLTIGIGKTTMGNEFCFDLQKMPHLLVAGATGAGKSVCINTIIVSILYKAKPDEVKFILIDPKKLELATYKSLVGYHLITAPDLDEYVMTTAENAVGILDSAITEMERRFELFADARVRNIQEYHKKQEQDPTLEKVPYIVVLIDELADLMMTSGRAVEDPITRLAQKARAVGLHLVVATQRPSVDVITGLIKSNFPARISFQVSSKIDSRTILDQMGAETLLGRGDMLFLPPGSASPVRLHNAYVTLEEIERIMEHICKQSKPEELLLPERKKEVLDSDFKSPESDRDELLFDAAKLVVNNQQASVSLLQRKFKIGYSRAGRLVDELEALGIISGYSGSKARDVLVDESYIDKIFN